MVATSEQGREEVREVRRGEERERRPTSTWSEVRRRRRGEQREGMVRGRCKGRLELVGSGGGGR